MNQYCSESLQNRSKLIQKQVKGHRNWLKLIRNGLKPVYRVEFALTGRIRSPVPVKIQIAPPPSPAYSLAGDLIHGGAARRHPGLRFDETNMLVGSTCAAVACTSPASSVCIGEGGGARRRTADADDWNWCAGVIHWTEAVVRSTCGGPKCSDGGDRDRGGVRRSLEC
jgi:hypothetical protein